MQIIRIVRRPPNECPQCGGGFNLKAKVRRLNQRSEAHYLQCNECKQVVVCNHKLQKQPADVQPIYPQHTRMPELSNAAPEAKG
jgi:hypothetical protein